jgi:hypothetical protein
MAEAPIPTTPKELFLASPHREEWERIVGTKTALAAKDAALLQFIYEQPDGSGPSDAWDQHSQLAGAKKMLRLLFNLHLKETSKPPIKLTQLPIPK